MAEYVPSGKWDVSDMRVKDFNELHPGHHIHSPYFGTEYGLRRHMIVTEVDQENERFRAIHYNNSCKDSAKPLHEVIQTWEKFDFKKSIIKRFIYDPNDSYPPEEVILRAKHCLGKKEKEMIPIIPPSRVLTWYTASCYFAEWCYTGQGWQHFVITKKDGNYVW